MYLNPNSLSRPFQHPNLPKFPTAFSQAIGPIQSISKTEKFQSSEPAKGGVNVMGLQPELGLPLPPAVTVGACKKACFPSWFQRDGHTMNLVRTT